MTDTKNTRITRPDTGQEWRALGFYHEPDQAHQVWRLVGSVSGLRTIVRMLASQADKASGETLPAPLVVGPFDDFYIRVWERAGIDDDSIHGSADDLRRLSEIIEQKLSGAAVGAEIAIGNEYAANLEYTLLIAVRDEEFDPASQGPAIVNVPTTELEVMDDDGGEMVGTEVLPALPFRFYQEGLGQVGDGLIRLESDRVIIEFKTKGSFFGMGKSEVKEVGLPFDTISDVRFKRGMFSAEIAIQGRDMKTMDGLPTVKHGRVRLRFKRDLRGDAEWFAMELERLFESGTESAQALAGVPVARPRHELTTEHAGSKKWFPIQIGFIGPSMLVDPDYSIYGMRIGFVLGENRDVFGLDVGFVLRVSGRMYGLQLAFITAANDLRGVQCAFVNHAEQVYGCQIGFINKTRVLRGVQLGFLNSCQTRDGEEKVMPVINIGL